MSVEPSEDMATTTTDATDGEETEPPSGEDTSAATVSIAGETFLFGATGFIAERCNPDFFGGAHVVLQMVDEDGNGMIVADQIVTLDPRHHPERPGQYGHQGSDDWPIEENRIQGTATFASTAGEGPVQGTFDVTCIEE